MTVRHAAFPTILALILAVGLVWGVWTGPLKAPETAGDCAAHYVSQGDNAVLECVTDLDDLVDGPHTGPNAGTSPAQLQPL